MKEYKEVQVYDREATKKMKRYVRYATGAEMYDMCQKTFEELAKKANATHKVGKMVLVNPDIIDDYLEKTCRIIDDYL
jgi:hypothetical protein